MTSQYSFWKGVGKTVIQLAAFSLPMALTTLQSMPETSVYLDMSLGALLSLVLNFLKVKSKEAGWL